MDLSFATCKQTLVILLLGFGSCSKGEPQAGVMHLDPRLSDGGSSAELLEAKREVVRSWDFPTGQNAEWQPSALAVGERFSRAWVWEAGDDESGIDAASANGLSWRSVTPRSTRARLEWRRDTDPADSWPNACSAELTVAEDASGNMDVGIQLGTHPGWLGKIVALRLQPDALLTSETLLGHVELSRRGFGGGFEALGIGEAGGRSDGGVVSLNDSGRRTWPTSFGVPLFAECEVPLGGALVFDVALSEAHRDSLERVHLAIDVAEVGAGKLSGEGWQRLWYRSIVPRMTPSETLWTAFNVSLEDFVGQRVQVRLRAWAGHGKDSVAVGIDGELERASVFWGSPEVIGDATKAPLPNILLVTLDTTRADYGGAHTPFFDTLRERGIVFTDSLATSNSTQPSHASILTGTWPDDHGVHDNYALLVGGNRTLAERMRELGYHTIGAVSQRYIGTGAGFGQGFDEFLQASPNASMDGADTVEALRARVDEWQSVAPDRPLFIWMHLFDAHTPYVAPEGYAANHAERFGAAPARQVDPAGADAFPVPDEWPTELAFLKDSNSMAFAKHQYGVEVSYADAMVENFASRLAEAGMFGRTAFFVTADHGESLGEHGIYFGHEGLFGETIQVPLFMVVPGHAGATALDVPTSGVDLAPTILRYAAAGREVDMSGFRGRDLLAGIVTAPLDVGDAGELRFFEHANRTQTGVRRGSWHLIDTHSAAGKQLFDLAGDPGMHSDVAGSNVGVVAELEAALAAWEAAAWDVAAGENTARETTQTERDELSGIGYSD